MDHTERKQVEQIEKLSGEHRIRFRYELWSHAAQDFRSPPAVTKRLRPIVSNGAAVALTGSAAGPDNASASEAEPDPRNAR